jgi:hypothetical protein
MNSLIQGAFSVEMIQHQSGIAHGSKVGRLDCDEVEVEGFHWSVSSLLLIGRFIASVSSAVTRIFAGRVAAFTLGPMPLLVGASTEFRPPES